MIWIFVGDMPRTAIIIVSDFEILYFFRDVCSNVIRSVVDHSYSPCLAVQLNDVGTGHSPIYGFAKDGFPIFGPYQKVSVLARSCWATRDYSDAMQGCADGKRSCEYLT